MHILRQGQQAVSVMGLVVVLLVLALMTVTTHSHFHRPLTRGWHKVNTPLPGLWQGMEHPHHPETFNSTYSSRSHAIAAAFAHHHPPTPSPAAAAAASNGTATDVGASGLSKALK